MKLHLQGGSITGGELFKLVWRGYFFGVLTIFVPVFVAIGTIVFTSGRSNISLGHFLLGLAILPLVAAGQGVLFGGLIMLGHLVRPPRVKAAPGNDSSGSN